MTKTRGLLAYLVSIAVFAAFNMAGAAVHYSNNRALFEAQEITYRVLWGQSGVIYAYLFLPIVLAAWVAMAVKVEHDDRNMQRMAGCAALFRHVLPGKLLAIAGIAVIGTVIYWVTMVVAGLMLGFGLNSELGTTFLAALSGALGAAAVMTVLLYVAMRARSFLTPVVVGVIGSVAGLVLVLVARPLSVFWPFCLPGNLMFVRSAGQACLAGAVGNVAMALLWMAAAIAVLVAHLRWREF
ncbi:ABC transporter permease [Dermatophilus congolensis]|uniref:ABC transporter permease n=1 Tax=Dermatophilus congolensis TaxID=1863 RepID=UPI001AAF1623|nr:ABC transporter permease [Dermatophilus congolensis]MBO3142463.1 ABC transporter permease subunit [Dermatophilus congolensis]MBO3151452.1 ABC transporter permease subunit [Dermatophilus congolensis]MBO3161544.1 ABC transporter permease subunit [Dermatophilus congolensis]MBO3162738.1 ABC transporter permease subunit [Dermatophilus congolensis]MBO3176292.1 ABC transporter permease subunit [Dermatophilus congolensis]